MARRIIVAQFHDYSAAHRALCELIQTGILPNEISIIPGDRSNHQGANRDFGLLDDDAERYLAAVRRGRTLIAVDVDEPERARIAELIEQHAPIEIKENRHRAVTLSLAKR